MILVCTFKKQSAKSHYPEIFRKVNSVFEKNANGFFMNPLDIVSAGKDGKGFENFNSSDDTPSLFVDPFGVADEEFIPGEEATNGAAVCAIKE